MKLNHFNKAMAHLVRPSRERIMASAKKEMGIPQEAQVDGFEMLNWVNWNNKMYGDNKIPVTSEEKKTGERIERLIDIGNNKKPPGKQRYVYNVAEGKLEDTKPNNWKYTSWSDGQKEIEEMKIKDKQKNKRDVIEMVGDIFDVTKPKNKKIIKKEIKVVEKPRPTIQEQLDFQDHLNTLDPFWWIEDKEEEKPSTSNKARLLYEKLKQLKKEREETEGIAALLKLNRGRIT